MANFNPQNPSPRPPGCLWPITPPQNESLDPPLPKQYITVPEITQQRFQTTGYVYDTSWKLVNPYQWNIQHWMDKKGIVGVIKSVKGDSDGLLNLFVSPHPSHPAPLAHHRTSSFASTFPARHFRYKRLNQYNTVTIIRAIFG